jgi:hypothetical protein
MVRLRGRISALAVRVSLDEAWVGHITMAATSQRQVVPPSFSLRDIEAAHINLMRLYKVSARHAEGLGVFVGRTDVEVDPQAAALRRLSQRAGRALLMLLTPRLLVRPFIGSHISKRLKQLRKQYQWIQQELMNDDPSREWFAARQQELQELSDELPSWSRLVAAAKLLGPPAIAAVALYLGGEDLWPAVFGASLSDLATLAMLALFVAIYASPPFSTSFAYKRAVFLGGPEHPTTDEARATSVGNVYVAEDAMWKSVGARKKPEPKLDRVFPTYIFFAWAVAEAIGAATFPEVRGPLIAFAVMFLVFGIIAVWSDRHRQYR